jgi:general secretion pathway protein D
MREKTAKLGMLPLLGLLAGLALSGCSAAGGAFRKGHAAAQQGNWDAAVVHYTRAVNDKPDNIEYRMALERALIEAGAYHVQQAQKKLAAEDLPGAVEELELATRLDPSNRYAQSILTETQGRLAEREARKEEAGQFEERRRRAQELFGGRPILEPSSTAPIQLRFAEDTSLQKIFEVLSKLSGINILFDESFRDKRVTVDLVDVSFEEALDKLVLINRLFYKIVDTSTIIIVPDNAQKHRQYDDLVLRTFYIVNAEVNTVANMLRTIAGIQRVQPNPELKSITVRATPDQVAVAERIVDLNDKSKSEIMLDIEILEINRTKALEYGLKAAEYAASLSFAPAGASTTTSGTGGTTTTTANGFRLNRLTSVDASDFLLKFPTSASFMLFKSKSEARLLANPKLRASEGQPAELRLGQEVPVPVTSFVQSFGAGSVPATPVTSFQYKNVGINVTITPKVFVDGEIELQLQLETSTQLDTRTIGGIELPVFGTRNVNNVVRLRDGETNIVGGLIQQEDRKTLSGFPGLVDVPLLSKVFGNNADNSNSGDVVFSITPHIVRAPRVTEMDLAPLPMGTEQQIKVPGNRPRIFDAAKDAAVIEPPAAEQPPSAPAPAPPPPPAPTPEPLEPELQPVPELVPAPGPGSTPETSAPSPSPSPSPSTPPVPAGPVSVLFSPPVASLAVGGTVEVALVAGGAQGLSSGEITINYDPASLQVTNVQAGAFLGIDGKPVNFIPAFSAGQVRIQFSRPEDTTGLVGSGHLARLTFEVLAKGPPLIVSATGSLRNVSGVSLPASFASLRIEVQ